MKNQLIFTRKDLTLALEIFVLMSQYDLICFRNWSQSSIDWCPADPRTFRFLFYVLRYAYSFKTN